MTRRFIQEHQIRLEMVLIKIRDGSDGAVSPCLSFEIEDCNGGIVLHQIGWEMGFVMMEAILTMEIQ